MMLANSLADLGKVKNAIAEYQRVLAQEPDHVRAHNNLANLLAAQGRSVQNIYDTLMATARTPGSTARGVYTTQYGWGIVDAEAAVAAPGAAVTTTKKRGAKKG